MWFASRDGFYLYNVRQDPREKNNLIADSQYAGIVAELKTFLAAQMPYLVPLGGADSIPKAPEGKAMYYSNVYSPGWCCL